MYLYYIEIRTSYKRRSNGMEKEIYLARKISAQVIAEAIEQETASIIGRHVSCQFLTEDYYW